MESPDSSSAVAKQAFFFFTNEGTASNEGMIINPAGWAETPSQLEPNVVCSSGNCEWPVFESIEDDGGDFDILCELRPPQEESYTYLGPESIVWSPYQSAQVENQTYCGMANQISVIAQAELSWAGNKNETGDTFAPPDLWTTLRFTKATQCAVDLRSRNYTIAVVNGTASISSSTPNYGDLYETEFSITPCWKPTDDMRFTPPNETKLLQRDLKWTDTSRIAFSPPSSFGLEHFIAGMAWTEDTVKINEERHKSEQGMASDNKIPGKS
ncbi:uncharacterized protein BDV14DRAFT_195374 [Aspergillus stella-maris]|uniref:uncharacterized protein n=1 Tax=Aspergillus stella-maris TaxID=1810926 RepID=UPI003CCE12B1